MPKQPKQTTYVSVCLSEDEKAVLDQAAALAGKARNRFIRDWISTLRKTK